MKSFERRSPGRGRGTGASTREKGREAEREAVAWLRLQGYEVVERNVTTDAGEIDLVARDGEYLCFVEIKARASASLGPAIAAVDARKQARIIRCAKLYLAARDLDEVACRFDVLGIDREVLGEAARSPEESAWRFTLIRDAFQLASR